MGILLPSRGILDQTQTDVAGSVAGGWAYPFKIPTDTDNVLVKFSPSITAGGISAIFQTSDDGGTTFYDVARTSIASNSLTGVHWMSIPTIAGASTRASIVAVGSTVSINTIGPSAASTLTQGQYSGLPIMGIQNRIFMITTGNATASTTRVQVIVNQKSGTS